LDLEDKDAVLKIVSYTLLIAAVSNATENAPTLYQSTLQP